MLSVIDPRGGALDADVDVVSGDRLEENEAGFGDDPGLLEELLVRDEDANIDVRINELAAEMFVVTDAVIALVGRFFESERVALLDACSIPGHTDTALH